VSSRPSRGDGSVPVADFLVEVDRGGPRRGSQRVIASRDSHLAPESVAEHSLLSDRETTSCEGDVLFAIVLSDLGTLRSIR
jgi:hypothetical protein